MLFDAPSFINSLELEVHHEMDPKEMARYPYRKFRNSEYYDGYLASFSQFLKLHRSSVEVLTILIEKTSNMNLLNPLESVGPNLTSLEIYINEQNQPLKHKIDFPNLKVLKTCGLSSFLSWIGKHRIVEFYCKGLNSEIDNEYPGDGIETIKNHPKTLPGVDDFLETCSDLKILTINKFVPIFDPLKHFYRLESFSIRNFEKIIDKEVLHLLKHQQESLKTLHLENCHKSIEFAVNNLKLETFSFKGYKKTAYVIRKPNYSIKKIKIVDNCTEHDRLIVSQCLNLEQLCSSSFERCPDLAFSLQNLKNMKHLVVGEFTNFVDPGIINSLETLEITRLESDCEHRAWISLAICCPHLKRVKITLYKFFIDVPKEIPTKQLKKLLECCKNLEEIFIGPHFDFNNKFVETILSMNHKKFRYLRIKSNNYTEDLEMAKKFNDTKIRCEIEYLGDERIDFFETDDKRFYFSY